MKNGEIISVFKTSIQSEKEAAKVWKYLNQNEHILRVSFDLEDCDNILRVVSNGLDSIQNIENILNRMNISCKQLY